MALHGCFTFILEDGKDVMSVVFSDIQVALWKDGRLTLILHSNKGQVSTPISLEQAQGFYDAWSHAIRVANAMTGADRPMISSMSVQKVKLA